MYRKNLDGYLKKSFIFAFLFLFITLPALAADLEKELVGWWALESFQTEVKATGEKKVQYGEKPNGYLIITPDKRMMVIVTAEHRKTPGSDADAIVAFRSMVAYGGIYRVEGDKFTTKVDIAWNEAWTGTEQVRFLKLDGDKLFVTTAWLPDPNTPGNPEIRGVVVWKRMKPAP